VNVSTDFEWPKALRAVKKAAEDGTLHSRTLYPVEIKALCELVAGAPLDENRRDIAPGMSAARREEKRAATLGEEKRAAYYFTARFENGRVWQCSLFSDWMLEWYSGRNFEKLAALSPKNIVRAVTRSVVSGAA
jgi:hypothetical protein